ncbi:MAG TPA: hypothetical protein VD837_07180 [Terriglobales bacterium]|nr:hypothetical protein [Terriglobales bacterium]
MAIGARVRELRDLETVHAYSVALLGPVLGHAVLVPQQLQGDPGLAGDVDAVRRWLALLDLAISPQMMREGPHPDSNTSEALLRYFVNKRSLHRSDRDKTDLIATRLYQAWRAVQPRPITVNEDAPYTPQFSRVPEFAGPLYALCCDVPIPTLPEEHRQLVHELPFLQQEAHEFRRFDELMDSGILERMREIKNCFGPSMYHPFVLASFAEFNTGFGRRFDRLARDAVRAIKEFAATESRCGSRMSRLDSSVSVKQLAEVEEDATLAEEYQCARAKLQQVSSLAKALEKLRAQDVSCSHSGSTRVSRLTPEIQQQRLEQTLRHLNHSSATRTMADSIREFVRSSDELSSLVLPRRKGRFALTREEREAFCARYAEENSFRGMYAATLVECVAIMVRVHDELEQLGEHRESAHLWKRHVEVLDHLVKAGQATAERGGAVMSMAKQRGLENKVEALQATLDRLGSFIARASQAVRTLDSATAPQVSLG